MHALHLAAFSWMTLGPTNNTLQELAMQVPNPHGIEHATRVSGASLSRADPTLTPSYGIPCDAIGRTFRFNTGSEGYQVDIQVIGVDRNFDGRITGSNGFYSPVVNDEIIDLRVVFSIDGQPADLYVNVESGSMYYPFLYFDWDLTTDLLTSWDLGADPGTFFFSGQPVTGLDGILFFDSVRGVVGSIGNLVAVDPGPEYSVENSVSGFCYSSISTAIGESVANDELLVTPGEYLGPIVWPAHDIRLIGSGGAENTVVFASDTYGEPIVVIGPNASRSSLLRGFEFNGNFAIGTSNSGTALVIEGSPTVTDCTVTESYSDFSGGGVAVHGNPRLERVSVIGNGSSLEGGGIYIGPPPSGFRLANSSPRSDLSAVGNIGGSTKPELVNCFVAENLGGYGAGGIAVYRDADIVNCTVYANCSFGEPAGIGVGGAGSVLIANTVIWANDSLFNGFGDDLFDYSQPGTLTLSHNVFSGATGSNLDLDPMLFYSGSTIQVQPGSPVIDSGCNSLLPPGVALDLYQLPRLRDDPASADTGCGPAPVLDRGAVEF